MNNSAHEEEDECNATLGRKLPSAFDPKSGHHTRKGGCSCKQSGCRKPFCKCYAPKFSFSGRYQWLSRSLYESNEVEHIYNFSYNEDNIVNDRTDGQLLQLLQEDKGCRKPFCNCYASKFSYSGRYQWLSRSLYESNEVEHIYNLSYNEDNIVNDSTDGQLLQLLQEDKGIYDIFNR